jgi:hypothetical protein
VVTHFIAIVSTFRDWFRLIEMRPRGWSIGFSQFPAIAQITLSSVKISLSLSEVNCPHTLWNEAVLQSFSVFCTSKNYLCFITINSKDVDVLLILLLVFSKFLEPNSCFVLKMGSAVGDGFSYPRQSRTAIVCSAHVRAFAVRHRRCKSTLAA